MTDKKTKPAVTKTQLRAMFAAVAAAEAAQGEAEKSLSQAVKAVHEAIGSAKVTKQDGSIVRAICRKPKEEGGEPKYFLRTDKAQKDKFSL